ncbi:Relaxin-3 receptor 1 [Acipenser ruthenus]|uniref:Relaxin-3 receptor 1 n=1 Tax=Acipenser ruthenus TaxID=7906 RepID=A0A444V1F9_ACIRT|nr:Relaxin-3 receptor 1 [Acipenser ruthenus]
MVYSVVCALGLVGNLLVLYLLYSQHKKKRSTVNFFVMCLAVTDLHFVLTLPFWAVDTAMDFRWPFGKGMCKIISSVTTMSMYASVFFLTAMSVARYCSVASSLKMRPHPCACSAKWVSLLIWLVSLLATLPHAIYSTTALVTDEELCLVRFPDSGWDPQLLLGLYQTQKVLLGFVIPLVIISLCYILLLRFVISKRVRGAGSESSHHQRRSKVTRSVTVVVLSFFLCWLPNQALTLWGVFIKFDLVPFSKAFYNAQACNSSVEYHVPEARQCQEPVGPKVRYKQASDQQPQQQSQQPFQELVLNEDEKKLLAKEGVSLPSQLPLTKGSGGCELGGMELLDLLFDQQDGILRNEGLGGAAAHHGNAQGWPITEQNLLVDPDSEDFLNSLLGAGDSVSSSPLWSPATSDSGISEDPHSDQLDSPQHCQTPDSPAVYQPAPTQIEHPCLGTASTEPPQAMDMLEPDIAIDLEGWDSSFLSQPGLGVRLQQAGFEMFPLTVKDLLLSNTSELDCILTLLMNIVCLCRSLITQLRKLQDLVMHGSNKTAQTGTCILVLLLSFSLILFPSLRPFSDSQVAHEGGDFIPVRVQSRSLHGIESSRVFHAVAHDHVYSAPEQGEGPGTVSSLEKLLKGHGLVDSALNASQAEALELEGLSGADPITGRRVTTVRWSGSGVKQGAGPVHADEM